MPWIILYRRLFQWNRSQDHRASCLSCWNRKAVTCYRVTDLGDMKIIYSSFDNNKLKRKIFEALYIKQYRPPLNSQEQWVGLKLVLNNYIYIKSLKDLGKLHKLWSFYFTVILVFRFYSDDGLWNVKSKY